MFSFFYFNIGIKKSEQILINKKIVYYLHLA